jgi:Peptidase family M1 domain/Peptidase M1 N-terminal domain
MTNGLRPRPRRTGRHAARVALLGTVVALVLMVQPAQALDGQGASFEPGAPGAGDPYFPLDGNGGYDARHYRLDIRYNPNSDRLHGTATIRARTTQNLSRFNLDLDGLRVESVQVDGRPVDWSRGRGELTITPRRGLIADRSFIVTIRYDGRPQTIVDALLGVSGFIHTDDGAIVAGQPHVASTWYPVNDHPSDKATYTFRITVPKGLEAVANGVLFGRRTNHGWTTWMWDAKEPMASYLTTATVGDFDLRAYQRDGIRFWDAIDPDVLALPASPRTGTRLAISKRSEPSYKRLQRTISVPAGGATLSFWVTRDTEPNWDYFFVEAHTARRNDWTTLPDLNGHTSRDTGFVCPFWLDLHPFLAHYQTPRNDGTCAPRGTTGRWHAASGFSDGWERWRVDLSRFAGRNVVVSLTYASDDLIQFPGAFVDDIVVSTGEGSTSFEADGTPLDGWRVPGPPRGSAPNPNDWIAGTKDDVPTPVRDNLEAAFGLQDEIIAFLAGRFGEYPFSAAGGIVDDPRDLGFALEIQTRPIYSIGFFFERVFAEDVVVHELAHQWFGDSLTLRRWRHIWLNEGFATYAEWLWSEHAGRATADQIFADAYAIPAEDPFWSLKIGDPGAETLLEFPVYLRGAMTLHRLRERVGDQDFFRILRTWATTREGDLVTTGQFIAHAERISGEELSGLFHRWLFTRRKPQLSSGASARQESRAVVAAQAHGPTDRVRDKAGLRR